MSRTRRNLLVAITTASTLLLVAGISPAQRGPAGDGSRKKVLVELFTSQGCDMCPAAEQLIEQLPRLGFSRDRVIPLAFHVDYFNKPWKDPFSDRQFSAREWQYSILYNQANKVGKEDYLYFTPMLMVDGRYPMLGSDREKAKKAISQALATRPGVSLALDLRDGSEPRTKSLQVTLSKPSAELAGRAVLVGAALYEDPVVTRVDSGENAGKTLTEHYAVRRLQVRSVEIPRSTPSRVTFEFTLDDGWNPEGCGLVVYVQDEQTGRMHQAESRPWQTAPLITTRP